MSKFSWKGTNEIWEYPSEKIPNKVGGNDVEIPWHRAKRPTLQVTTNHGSPKSTRTISKLPKTTIKTTTNQCRASAPQEYKMNNTRPSKQGQKTHKINQTSKSTQKTKVNKAKTRAQRQPTTPTPHPGASLKPL